MFDSHQFHLQSVRRPKNEIHPLRQRPAGKRRESSLRHVMPAECLHGEKHMLAPERHEERGEEGFEEDLEIHKALVIRH